VTREKTIVSAQFLRDLADRLTELARERDRSVSSLIRMAVAAHLERETRKEHGGMRLPLTRPPKADVLADELSAARIAAARRNPVWAEIPNDLVARGRGWFVSAESDRIYAPYRGTAFATGSATAISDRAQLFFTVDGDEIALYERQPGTWSDLLEKRARRGAAA